MIPYCSRTGTRSSLLALRDAGWRILISATGAHRNEGMSYAIDNGAFTAFKAQRAFDHAAFRTLLASHGAGADWVVLPDVVAKRDESIAMSRTYLDEFGAAYRWLLAVQDGMTARDVDPFLGTVHGLAIGGMTEWKERTARYWGDLCRANALYLHMLRVNTARRIALAAGCGCDSFDGTSVSQFPSTLGLLDFHRRQRSLEVG